MTTEYNASLVTTAAFGPASRINFLATTRVLDVCCIHDAIERATAALHHCRPIAAACARAVRQHVPRDWRQLARRASTRTVARHWLHWHGDDVRRARVRAGVCVARRRATKAMSVAWRGARGETSGGAWRRVVEQALRCALLLGHRHQSPGHLMRAARARPSRISTCFVELRAEPPHHFSADQIPVLISEKLWWRNL